MYPPGELALRFVELVCVEETTWRTWPPGGFSGPLYNDTPISLPEKNLTSHFSNISRADLSGGDIAPIIHSYSKCLETKGEFSTTFMYLWSCGERIFRNTTPILRTRTHTAFSKNTEGIAEKKFGKTDDK